MIAMLSHEGDCIGLFKDMETLRGRIGQVNDIGIDPSDGDSVYIFREVNSLEELQSAMDEFFQFTVMGEGSIFLEEK